MLLLGQFNYGKAGILDRTHTRLFTFRTLRQLLRDAGFRIKEVRGVPAPFPRCSATGVLGTAALRLNQALIGSARRCSRTRSSSSRTARRVCGSCSRTRGRAAPSTPPAPSTPSAPATRPEPMLHPDDVGTRRERDLLPVALCAVAATALGVALQIGYGFLNRASLVWLTVAVVVVLVALVVPVRARADATAGRLLVPAVAMLLGVQFVALLFRPPVQSLRGMTGWQPSFLLAIGVAVLGVVGLLLAGPRFRHLCVAVVLGVHAGLAVWLIRVSPSPPIDVFVFQRDSAQALLGGVNPYSITFPDIYGGRSPYYGPGISVDGRLTFGFPYPPLSALLSTLGEILGDVRFAQVLAMTGAAALMAYTRPGVLGGLAAALYLYTPRTFYVLENAWTEPFVVLFLAAAVFCAVRAPRALPYAFGLFLAVKQYAVLAAPAYLLLVDRPWTLARLWRPALRALAVVAVVSLPFALADPSSFLRSVVTLQFGQPFRRDALSYMAWLATPGGEAPFGAGVAFAAAAVVAALAVWRAPRTPAGFALSVAAVFLAFFAPNKQAFCNYYLFVIGALCVAVAAAATAGDRDSVSAGARPAP